MTHPMTAAVLAGADAAELARCPAPTSTLGLCLRKSEETQFDGVPESEIDVRQSLHLDEVPLPELAPDEALVAVMAGALNYNTVWSAMFRPVSTFRFLERFGRMSAADKRHDLDRHILGSDASGVVVRVGEGVRHFGIGDPVVIGTLATDEQDPIAQADGMLPAAQRAWGFETNYGGLAHYTVVKATQLLPKAAHLTWEEAASTTLCLMTAYRMLIGDNGARAKLGELVLIWGAAGGLGAYGVQLAKAAGCRVAGVVGGPKKAALARDLGCDLVIDRSEATDECPNGFTDPVGWKWLGSRIRGHFGEDVHHVFEHVGRETFGASVYLARRGGTIVTCGSSTGYRHEFDNRHLWMKLKRIIGSHGGHYHEEWQANELVRRGVIRPTLSGMYDLDTAAEGVRLMHSNEHLGKLGVRCLAPEDGQGVTDPAKRAEIGAENCSLLGWQPPR
ncbi:MAG: crotonyl-CoA carboxylase/reductase [Planctomycetota bacterium]|jgi:crotonyl-CoA reductase